MVALKKVAVSQVPLRSHLLRHRFKISAVADAVLWLLALSVATVVRHDFALDRVNVTGVLAFVPIAMGLQVAIGFASGLYRGRARFGSFDEVMTLASTVTITTLALFIGALMLGSRPVPLGAVAGGGAVAMLSMGALRFVWRSAMEFRRRPSGDDLRRIIVFGAGEAGVQAVTAMLRDPASPYLPVALLDDDPAKRNLRIMGVRVRGGRNEIPQQALAAGADSVLIAIPTASGELVREIADLAQAAGLGVKVVPPVGELFGDAFNLGDIRDLTPADLLGRHEVQTDLASIAEYITGKVVLVTGAGGSIGSELCRQLYRFAPSELILLDRDESALHAVQLSIEGRAMLDSENIVLADIRDVDTLSRVFSERRPDVVFHAAALKHMPLLERFPGEAVKTNVWGTLCVLEAAAAAGVDRFVNISTDKAADPENVLGYSKRITERLTAQYATTSEGRYLSVRFGNVLGSRGSMLGAFQQQIAAGGPVTVTDPGVTRFFMTVQEAVELVIQAGAIGESGEVLVLDMGKPVKIDDVARRLAAQADRPIKIVYTGLRAGEKLHEVLLGTGEDDVRPVHPLISHVCAPPLETVHARQLDPWKDAEKVIESLRETCELRVDGGSAAAAAGQGR